jgi:archaellum component FlaC
MITKQKTQLKEREEEVERLVTEVASLKEEVENITHPTLESIKTNTFIPKSKNRPRIELPPTRINSRIDYMKTYAFIRKFIGI